MSTRVVVRVLRRGALLGAGLLIVGSLLGASAPPPNSGAKITRILVKKSARTMDLFEGDTVVASYSVAVGKGGPGHKRMEGDLVTPVGRYHIVTRVPSHLRIFMRIDYPNAEDRVRFEDLKKRGELPKNATIGSEIGIHGEPPEAKPFKKAEYQSHGCVVVEDKEIDQIARMVPNGTIVDIED